MSATDELRRMLDERGVEWEDGGEGLTIIPAQDGVPRAWEVNTWPSGKDMGDCLWVQNRHPLTPAQAIAATMGNEDAYTCEDVESAFVRGYSLGLLPVGSDPQWDENRQTVDEHMAELGWVRATTLGDVPRLPYFWTHDDVLHVELPRLPESISVRLPDQRDREVGSARTWQYTQGSETRKVAYLLMATDIGDGREEVLGAYATESAAMKAISENQFGYALHHVRKWEVDE